MGGIRLPGPQPANPSYPAASGAINKPSAALQGSLGRRGLLAVAAPWGLRQAPQKFIVSPAMLPWVPLLLSSVGRGATQGETHRAHCGSDSASGSSGPWQLKEWLGVPAGQEGSPSRENTPHAVGVGCAGEAQGRCEGGILRACSCSAWLLVQLCIPSVCPITSSGGSQQALRVWDGP